MRGWAFDPARPDDHLTVEILCGPEVVGRAQADLYRRDLEEAGRGGGDHAFILALAPSLADGDLERVSARAAHAGARPQPLRRLEAQPEIAPPLPPIEWPGRATDPEHRPVFVLGAARSGTSAVAHALLAGTQYQGHEEGHFLDVLAPLLVAWRGFQDSKTDERIGDRNTTATRFADDFIEKGLASIVIEAMRALFPAGLWLDKTPNANMAHLAPSFHGIWPNARFIFMKRSPVDNIASRLRKFEYDFAHNCREWASVMEAWLSVREKLAGVSIELDQQTVAREPTAAASAIATLLGLPAIEQHRVAQMLARERPQQTGEGFDAQRPLAETGWRPDWVRTFRELCGPMMAAYGYRE